MKTIIHIGQHKTGTTSIQHYLQSHRKELANAGLYIPDVLMGFGNPSHFLLNVYALDEGRDSTAKIMLKETVEQEFFETIDERLRKDIKRHYQNARDQNCKQIIWTNEGLYLLNSIQEYTKLRQLFDEFSNEIQCVCCFREKSAYQQSFKKQLEGLGLPLSDNPDSYRYLADDSWLMDYERKEQLISQVFDKTLILDYDPEDMVSTFLDSLDLPAEGDTKSLRLNSTA